LILASLLKQTKDVSPSTEKSDKDQLVNSREGGEKMKTFVTVLLVGMLALSLGACAKKASGEKVRVKCPACGYEFEVPAERP
jgi:hypothetical protein